MSIVSILCMAKQYLEKESISEGSVLYLFNYDEDAYFDEYTSLAEAKKEMRKHKGYSFTVYVASPQYETSEYEGNPYGMLTQEVYDEGFVDAMYSYRMNRTRLERFE